MNKYDKIAKVCLYFGVLLTLAALDWWWYAQRFQNESFVLELPFIQAVYILWIAVTAGCFAVSAVLFRKAAKEQQAHRQ